MCGCLLERDWLMSFQIVEFCAAAVVATSVAAAVAVIAAVVAAACSQLGVW